MSITMTGGLVERDSVERRVDTNLGPEAHLLVRDGDVAYNMMRMWQGVLGRGRFDCLVSPAYIVLRPNEKVDSAFAEYLFSTKTAIAEFKRRSYGVVDDRLRLYFRDLVRIRFALPRNLNDQRAIAAVLSTLDETITRTQSLIEKYQQIKLGIMRALFSHGVTDDGKLRPSPGNAPRLYKESPIGLIPKEWDVARLADRRRPGRAHIKTGPFGSSLKSEHWVVDGRPVITIGSLGESRLIDAELLFVNELTARHLTEYELDTGDVVFSRVADVGRSVMITARQKGWIMSSNLMRISLDPRSVRPGFLQAQLASDVRVRMQIRRTVNSGGRDIANSQILNRLIFAWPKADEQDRVLLRAQAIEKLIESEQMALLKFQTIRLGLMNDLLTWVQN
jgi:type I restriction enzyme S subunit